ncbi:hypothetical protein BS47DRAFT_1360743 [Hydnum rufescens UP504]|uniref:Uncharacterized protein n=1 Tax=Hydnum rufescens UP504 TaxID=1448309 RepID=A0A9P6B3S3_9AGAM|nr:hypothetical protein BS47DRAFT_1360743 [Hydnum rufescens UP504]
MASELHHSERVKDTKGKGREVTPRSVEGGEMGTFAEMISPIDEEIMIINDEHDQRHDDWTLQGVGDPNWAVLRMDQEQVGHDTGWNMCSRPSCSGANEGGQRSSFSRGISTIWGGNHQQVVIKQLMKMMEEELVHVMEMTNKIHSQMEGEDGEEGDEMEGKEKLEEWTCMCTWRQILRCFLIFKRHYTKIKGMQTLIGDHLAGQKTTFCDDSGVITEFLMWGKLYLSAFDRYTVEV